MLLPLSALAILGAIAFCLLRVLGLQLQAIKQLISTALLVAALAILLDALGIKPQSVIAQILQWLSLLR